MSQPIGTTLAINPGSRLYQSYLNEPYYVGAQHVAPKNSTLIGIIIVAFRRRIPKPNEQVFSTFSEQILSACSFEPASNNPCIGEPISFYSYSPEQPTNDYDLRHRRIRYLRQQHKSDHELWSNDHASSG